MSFVKKKKKEEELSWLSLMNERLSLAKFDAHSEQIQALTAR